MKLIARSAVQSTSNTLVDPPALWDEQREKVGL